MNDQELIHHLRSNETSRVKTRRCPDENAFASYVHGQVPEAQRRELESHFADCDACIETLSLLVTTPDAPQEAVPASLLVRARSLAESKPRFLWRWRWVLATASASVLVVALFGAWRQWTSRNTDPTNLVAINTEPIRTPTALPSPSHQEPASVVQKPKAAEAHPPVVRGTTDELKPVLVSPRNGGSLNSEQTMIRWRPVTDASLYEVRIVTTDGGHVLTQSTSDTQLSVHDQPLRIGEKYFVTVTAHLSGNRTMRSDLVSFQVTGKP